MIVDLQGKKITPKETARKIVRSALNFSDVDNELEAVCDPEKLTERELKLIRDQHEKFIDRLWRIVK